MDRSNHSGKRRAEWNGAERAHIRGMKLDLHAQEIFRKMEVARSDGDGIPRFFKGVE